jgi:curved DNA-binding protein CbpA
MMTYYEELGVPAEASREEIRQAYRRLVRLLHPDHCGDPATRVLAELQMRRLNGILEVLSRPDERAKYDRSLVEGGPIWPCPTAARDDAARREPPGWDGLCSDARWRRPTPAGDAARAQTPDWEVEKAYARDRARWAAYPSGLQLKPCANGCAWRHDARRRRRAAWRTAAALAGVMGLLLFCALMPSIPPVRKPIIPADANPRPLPAPGTRRRAGAPSPPAAAAQEAAQEAAHDAVHQGDAPTQVLSGYSPAAENRPWEAPSPANPDHTPVREAMRAPNAAGDGPPGEGPNGFSGDWVFVPAAETQDSAYPPEFIELRLREHAGAMRGSYRARYRVADRAISPNVAFQFEGRTGAKGCVLPWLGPGGSQGEVTLRLLANGNLQVAWEADRLGEELGLISGAATLVRRLE